jgi:acyl-CoA thioesterase
MTDALYHRDDDLFVPTVLARSPWDIATQHGGPPSALIVRAFEAAAPGMVIGRTTTEILAPIPMAPVRVGVQVTRPGKRIQLMEAQIVDEDGRPLLLGRAWAMRRRAEPLDLGDAPVPSEGAPPGPEASREFDHLFAYVDFADFAGTALETREAEGTAEAAGPATLWVRHRQPIVHGEVASATQRLIAAADCANGASWVVDPATTLFINVDLTMYLWREPVGDWLGLRSTTHWSEEGRGASDSELFDQRGWVGRSNQALYIEHRT